MKALFLILFLSLYTGSIIPQWTLTNFNDAFVLNAVDVSGNKGVLSGWHFGVSYVEPNTYFSTDGGHSWNNAQTPDSLRVMVDLQIMSENIIYGCGAKNISGTRDPDLRNVRQMLDDPLLSKNAKKALFLDTLYRGLFLQSTDAGQTWSVKGNLPDSIKYLTGMHFTSINTGFAIAHNFYSQGIIKTTDGGHTWNYSLNKGNASIEGVGFRDDLHGFAVGGVNLNNQSSGYFAGTTDGGMTWFEMNFETMNSFTDFRFVAPLKLVCSFNNIDGSSNIGLSLDTMTINGICFTPNSAMDGANGFTDGTVIGYGVLIENGVSRNFLKVSSDNGVSWTESQLPFQDLVYMTDSKLLNNSEWFITASDFNRGILLHTINAGGTPVELISFSAARGDNKILLEWSTSSEKNNSGFEIQRKTGGSDFITIGFVKGNGTTTEKQNYSFTDTNPAGQEITYRLKQVDLNGSYFFSAEVIVDELLPKEFYLSQNFPNPFNPETTIKYSLPYGTNVFFRIYDLLGREVYSVPNQFLEAGNHEIKFSAYGIPSGIYFYELKAGGSSQVRKMLLLK